MRILLLILYTSLSGAFNLNILSISKPKLNRVFMSYKPTEIIKSLSNKGMGQEWTYNDFVDNIKHHNVDAATVTDTNNMVIIDKNYMDIIQPENLHLFKGLPELTDNIIKELIENHINFDIYNAGATSGFLSNIPFPIQFLLIYVVGSYILSALMRNNMMNNVPNMKNNKEIIDSKEVDVRFSDVAGCEESKYELMEVVDFLKNPSKFKSSGAKIPSGILLEGPPGTGKTLLAKAVAGEAGVSFISASGSEFIEMFVGVGASRVRNLFEQAKKSTPCVIFIDEIDAVGRQRGAGLNSGNDEREQTLNQILTNMDGFDKSTGIIVLAATNRADILDSALTRPGRFDRQVIVPLPDAMGREKIFMTHLKNKFYDPKIDIKGISVLTQGFSGADIANLVNEAAIFTVRNNSTMIRNNNMLDAFEKMTIGLPKKTDNRDTETKRLVAYHEAGHALIAKLFDDIFDLRKITINANNNGAGGYTLFTPKRRYIGLPSKKFLLAKLMICLGGRVAEEELYNNKYDYYDKNYKDKNIFDDINDLDITTGASNDLKQANSIARTYVNLFGINDNLGLYDNIDNSQPFLGRDLGMNNNKASEYSKNKIDKEVERIVNFAHKKTIDIMKKNKEELSHISQLLLEKISLDIMDIKDIKISY